MQTELLLAALLMAIGLSLSAASTHLYQGIAKQEAMLRFDGKSIFGMLGNLVMSFVCGPYIMLQLGWKQEKNGSVAIVSVLVAALVAFGWALITGLLLLSAFVAVVH